jgi:hypothetical protein
VEYWNQCGAIILKISQLPLIFLKILENFKIVKPEKLSENKKTDPFIIFIQYLNFRLKG